MKVNRTELSSSVRLAWYCHLARGGLSDFTKNDIAYSLNGVIIVPDV